MTRYEYMTLRQTTHSAINDERLSALGALGWRLVYTGQTYFRLERTYYGDE